MFILYPLSSCIFLVFKIYFIFKILTIKQSLS
nr:MAG TPA: hypothetical protein [Caudoviricetes sp.]